MVFFRVDLPLPSYISDRGKVTYETNRGGEKKASPEGNL